MPSESGPTPNDRDRNGSGRWFERTQQLLQLMATEHGKALQEQARHHAENLARVERAVRDNAARIDRNAAEISIKSERNRGDLDRLMERSPKCPSECQRQLKDLKARVDSLGKPWKQAALMIGAGIGLVLILVLAKLVGLDLPL